MAAFGTGRGSFGSIFRSNKGTKDLNAEDREAAFAARSRPSADKDYAGVGIESTAPASKSDIAGEQRFTLNVEEVDHSWDGIALITLSTPNGAPLPGYEPGCHADFFVRCPAGEELVRQYSLFPMTHSGTGESEKGCYGVAVKREPDSRGGSIALHKVQAGETLSISAPRNNFGLAAGAQRSILVGAGVGIAPIYSLARELKRQGADYTILYFASSAERAVMSHLIDTHLYGQTRSVFASGARDKQAGYVEAALAESDVPAEDTHLYVCGPQGFMDGIIEVAEAHLPKSNIHWEAFRPSEETLAGDHRADGPFEVTFCGETYQIPEGTSVLDVFEDEDVPIMSRCQEGTCGTCVVKVTGGTPDHRDSFFTEEQHEKGAFATCVSRALSPSLTMERWKNI
ncbi:oxidoreductase [Corynebacterium sp. CNCTC7651]|uniref:PDR/VanB family oxidoreductase n=1 Tax=Corynebacterium sp. CNCTC7651 TaxID=2815361 RepID=UPI001F2AD5DC|nr:PDR/VanB family oxidoreductase [Corynebacterium sp. CNCTC7651]UIZ92666.1 oxidoreductase [Corynebacterium sp. CNCTC7651]